tara:strand:+ start:20 stop:889 length:870 start_codon:yes stop_codon:yes gene_type:complete
MKIHQFELDTTTDEVRASDSSSDQYFFFYDKHKILSAWIARKRKDKILILAYQEKEKGTMKIIDIQELLTAPESVHINALGTLLLVNKKGILCLSLEAEKIKSSAANSLKSIIKPWQEEIQKFPGMTITDQVVMGEKKLTRYTTISKDYYGDPFLEESILFLSEKACQSEHESDALVIIGNSKFNSHLNLIKCAKINLFDMPIINFAMNYTPLSNGLHILGWNKQNLQAIQIDYQENEREVIKKTDQYSIKFQEVTMKDRSTQYVDYTGRLVVLVDQEHPYRFYCLDMD